MLPLVLLSTLIPFSDATRLVNVTIDDTHGDERTGLRPEYPLDAEWGTMQGARGPLYYSVDEEKFYNKTCTIAINPLNMTLKFTGESVSSPPARCTAHESDMAGIMIYVFHALDPVVLSHDFTFSLDDGAPVMASYPDSVTRPSGGILYNHLAFQSGSLPQTQHTLTVHTPGAPMAACFDYAIYTVDETDDRTRSNRVSSPTLGSPKTSLLTIAKTSSSAIRGHKETAGSLSRSGRRPVDIEVVAATCAALATAALAAAGAWLYVRQRRRRTGRTAAGGVARPSDSSDVAGRGPEGEGTGSPLCILFATQPEKAAAPQRERDIERENADPARITPFVSQPSDAAPIPEPKSDKTRWEEPHQSAANITASMIAELERLCAENERALAESETARIALAKEIAMLREEVEPPPYSDGRGSETSEIAPRS